MKKKSRFSLPVLLPLLLVGLFNLNSCSLSRNGVTDRVNPYPARGKTTAGKLFVWEINLGKKKSYILGSLHFFKKESYPLAETIEKAYSQSDVLIVETLVEPTKRVSITLAKGIYPADDPRTLENQVNPATYRSVQERLQKSHMDIRLFAKFKPWYLAQTLAIMNIMKAGFHPGSGIDVYFLEKAKEKKEILALEKLEEQIDFYDRFPPRVNEAYLLANLQTSSGSGLENLEMEHLTAAWSAGDTRAVERLLLREIQKKPYLEILYEKLIYERNRNMTERIAGHLNTPGKRFFFVVGAYHLVGKRGILRLLKEKGFQLNQLYEIKESRI
ncbi:MAG: TraB/GumN family protein [Candidatus Aminicenantes bacterium]|nr:TraB/GumN family protein [Candidatus Aminicenantes bacterium]